NGDNKKRNVYICLHRSIFAEQKLDYLLGKLPLFTLVKDNGLSSQNPMDHYQHQHLSRSKGRRLKGEKEGGKEREKEGWKEKAKEGRK
ncbi:hypothetical protein, partial [Pseudomonas poae]|uniref:hypothetical protein n=1 Tax=Pseudomonas poae TaxID=200451 RepID=UPI0034D5167A